MIQSGYKMVIKKPIGAKVILFRVLDLYDNKIYEIPFGLETKKSIYDLKEIASVTPEKIFWENTGWSGKEKESGNSVYHYFIKGAKLIGIKWKYDY